MANAGVGYSINLAVVDEGWSVKHDLVEVAISRTMSALEQPQLWLVGTSGDAGSDLLASYRDQALALDDAPILGTLAAWKPRRSPSL